MKLLGVRRDYRQVNDIYSAKEINKLVLSSIEKYNFEGSDKNINGFSAPTEGVSICSQFLPGELAVIGGIPSSGKTTYMFNMLEHLSLTDKKPVLILSSEAKPEFLMMRLLASIGRVDISRLISLQLFSGDWPRLASAVKILAEAKINIADISNFEIKNIKKVVKKASENLNLSAVVIDSIQSIYIKNAENKATEIANISRELKSLAIENNLFIMVSSHLNRYLYQRPNKRPILTDLLGSGSIEHEADYVIFIHREEQFNLTGDRSEVEIIIAKSRTGPIFTTYHFFKPKYLRIEGI